MIQKRLTANIASLPLRLFKCSIPHFSDRQIFTHRHRAHLHLSVYECLSPALPILVQEKHCFPGGSLKAGSLAVAPKAGLCILLPCSPQGAGKSTWVRSLHDAAGSLSQPGSQQTEGLAGSRHLYSTVCSTVSLLYRLAFKNNHLDWKLGMPCCKSQRFKSYLLVRLVRLSSVFAPTPDSFQNSIQSWGKDLAPCQPLLLYLNHAKCIGNTEFSEITNKVKFIIFLKKISF